MRKAFRDIDILILIFAICALAALKLAGNPWEEPLTMVSLITTATTAVLAVAL